MDTDRQATGQGQHTSAENVGMQANFALSLAGFEGPIDLLLTLVREQGFDLSGVSIASLASQYLAFLARVPEDQLQRAADYLVMAAWLTLLKSRLLLPRHEQQELDEDPSLMAERLAHRLRQLQAMQQAAQALKDRRQLGRDFFAPGHQGILETEMVPHYPSDLSALLTAMRRLEEKQEHKKMRLRLSRLPVVSIDEARAHLYRIAGTLQHWRALVSVLPDTAAASPEESPEDRHLRARSRLASTFMASLEIQREGDLELRQANLVDPLDVRAVSKR